MKLKLKDKADRSDDHIFFIDRYFHKFSDNVTSINKKKNFKNHLTGHGLYISCVGVSK